MSFLERNRRWLLPTLGAAAAGVLWAWSPWRPPERPAPEPARTDPPRIPPVESDLTALATLPAWANDTAPLLLAGRHALTEELRNPPPPPVPRPLPRPAPTLPKARAMAAGAVPPPPLDFILETAAGREAWVKGRGYRPGEVLEGGYILRHINPASMVVSGPLGDAERPLKAAPGRKAARRNGERP